MSKTYLWAQITVTGIGIIWVTAALLLYQHFNIQFNLERLSDIKNFVMLVVLVPGLCMIFTPWFRKESAGE